MAAEVSRLACSAPNIHAFHAFSPRRCRSKVDTLYESESSQAALNKGDAYNPLAGLSMALRRCELVLHATRGR